MKRRYFVQITPCFNTPVVRSSLVGIQLDDLDLKQCTHLKIGMLKMTPELDLEPLDSDLSKLQADIQKLAVNFPKLWTILKIDVGHDKVFI